MHREITALRVTRFCKSGSKNIKCSLPENTRNIPIPNFHSVDKDRALARELTGQSGSCTKWHSGSIDVLGRTGTF